jgi:hypothetical protein
MDRARLVFWAFLWSIAFGCSGPFRLKTGPGACTKLPDVKNSQHPYLNATCDGVSPDRRKPSAWPGVVLGDDGYGGTASWTYEGDPPAGDRCTHPPVSRRVVGSIR